MRLIAEPRAAAVHDPVRRAVRHALSVCIAVLPLGWLLGVTIAGSPIDGFLGWTGGPVLASGAAHFAFVESLGRGAGAVAAWSGAVVVASRCTLYSAALAPRFSHQPAWFRWVGPYFLIDQLYVMVLAEPEAEDDPDFFRRYYLAFGCVMSVGWAIAIAAGILVGPVIPAEWRLELLLTALVVTMLRSVVRSPATRRAAAAALVTGLLTSGLPSGTGLLIATAVGIAVGLRSAHDEPNRERAP